jgi:hypothetical protein
MTDTQLALAVFAYLIVFSLVAPLVSRRRSR